MKNLPRRLVLLVAVCVVLSLVPGLVLASNPDGLTYLNTHVNTGNQRQDILAVAVTQLGYTEIGYNDTKFGDWGGYPYQPWCANFISWCARQAEVSTEILKFSAWANPTAFGITSYHGSTYTPQPGDLFFTSGFEHTGLVYQVVGEYFIALEGNAKEYDPDVPPDPDEESYYVMTNLRRISDHYFGVPEYEGTDREHTYVKGEAEGHPHKEFYTCTTCGSSYDTGYNAVHSDCAACMTCGCSGTGAGYYIVYNSTEPIRLRSGHSVNSSLNAYATVGEVVYVYGTSNGWAYMDYDGRRGHIQTKYLKAYCDVPQAPQVTGDKTEYILGEAVKISWEHPANTEQYRLKLLRNGEIYREKNLEMTRVYNMKDLPGGEYEAQVTAVNRTGLSRAGVFRFTIRDTYTLTYDAGGGVQAPLPQTQSIGQPVVVTDAIPVRLGFTFLGWTDGTKPYAAGDEIYTENHLTLYAVWAENQMTVNSATAEAE